MTDLQRATVFLSASFPSGDRGERFSPYDSSAIVDAVSAFARAILESNGTITFGGHPTITPLVLMISRELQVKSSVTVFHSEWFKKVEIPEVGEIEQEELGCVEWTPMCDDRQIALATMREIMIRKTRYAGALFIGGMEGICEEYKLVKELAPHTPCVPVAGPGGAAADLSMEDYAPLGLATLIESRAYPFMARQFVEAVVKNRAVAH